MFRYSLINDLVKVSLLCASLRAHPLYNASIFLSLLMTFPSSPLKVLYSPYPLFLLLGNNG